MGCRTDFFAFLVGQSCRSALILGRRSSAALPRARRILSCALGNGEGRGRGLEQERAEATEAGKEKG